MNWTISKFPSPQHRFMLVIYARAAGVDVWASAESDNGPLILIDDIFSTPVLVSFKSPVIENYSIETSYISWEEAIELLRNETINKQINNDDN